MKIAVVGHIRFAIAEPFAGGMEAHCAALCKALSKAGHDIVLFAANGSETAAPINAICDHPYEDILPWARWRGTEELARYQHDAFARGWDAVLSGGFDVVHNNALFPDLIDWAARDGVPMLTSQHVPPFGIMRDAVKRALGDDRLQFSVTSASQLPLWLQRPAGNLGVVHNGIDTEFWQPGEKGGRFLWSGRITPNKGTADALAAAHAVGAELDIAGTVEDEIYFARHVAPLLDDRRRYIGHLDRAALQAKVAAARAVVVTPAWDEPFGLVAAEALSCDVPVIAFDRGALSEVVRDCGVIVPAGDVAALAQAMQHPPRLAPGMARARAEACFSLQAMVAGYERLYRAAIAAVSHGAATESADTECRAVA